MDLNEWAGHSRIRNMLNTALLAFDVVKRGTVGVNGNTGAVRWAAASPALRDLGRKRALRHSNGRKPPASGDRVRIPSTQRHRGRRSPYTCSKLDLPVFTL